MLAGKLVCLWHDPCRQLTQRTIAARCSCSKYMAPNYTCNNCMAATKLVACIDWRSILLQ